MFFVLSSHSFCPKNEREALAPQSKRKFSTERILLNLRTWGLFQNFCLKNNYWEFLQESSGPTGIKVLDSITLLTPILLAVSLETFLTCLQYIWNGNIEVWYENFRFFFCIILETTITWGETAVMLSCNKVVLHSWGLKIDLNKMGFAWCVKIVQLYLFGGKGNEQQWKGN